MPFSPTETDHPILNLQLTQSRRWTQYLVSIAVDVERPNSVGRTQS